MSVSKIDYKNPEGLYSSNIFTQSITVSGNVKTIYFGGQNAADETGALVGGKNLELQARQVLRNIELILASEKADFSNLIKLNIYLLNGCDPRIGLRVFEEYIHDLHNPPLITVLFVSGFSRHDCLVEIDGIAAVENE